MTRIKLLFLLLSYYDKIWIVKNWDIETSVMFDKYYIDKAEGL